MSRAWAPPDSGGRRGSDCGWAPSLGLARRVPHPVVGTVGCGGRLSGRTRRHSGRAPGGGGSHSGRRWTAQWARAWRQWSFGGGRHAWAVVFGVTSSCARGGARAPLSREDSALVGWPRPARAERCTTFAVSPRTTAKQRPSLPVSPRIACTVSPRIPCTSAPSLAASPRLACTILPHTHNIHCCLPTHSTILCAQVWPRQLG